MNEEIMICCITALLAAIPIFTLRCHNNDTYKIQRFYYYHDHQKYILLELSLFILTIAFMFNIRYVASFFINEFIEEFGIKNVFLSYFPSLKVILNQSTK